jgi:hypothetical protein
MAKEKSIKELNAELERKGAKSRYIESGPEEDWGTLSDSRSKTSSTSPSTSRGVPEEWVPSDVRQKAEQHERRLRSRSATSSTPATSMPSPRSSSDARLTVVNAALAWRDSLGFELPAHYLKEYKKLTGEDWS